MKKALFGVVLLGALAGGATLLNLGEAVPVEELKQARMDCEKATEEICPGGIIDQGNFCLCLTKAKPGELTDEVTADKIPVAERKRKVLRCDYFDPETGTTSHVVRTEPITTPPAGAIIIDPNLVMDISMRNVEGPLDKKMQALCCTDCPDECWVVAGVHKQCPRCLCDNSCGNYCP